MGPEVRMATPGERPPVVAGEDPETDPTGPSARSLRYASGLDAEDLVRRGGGPRTASRNATSTTGVPVWVPV